MRIGSPPTVLIREQVQLAACTSFRVGGPAQWYAEPVSIADLSHCLLWASEQGLPLTFLGAGSNLLVSDRGVLGMVINTRKLRGCQVINEGLLWGAAGEPVVRLARLAAERGWSGLEWAIGIPGTVGGAVAMNAGAHGMCTAEVLSEIHILDQDHRPQVLCPSDLEFRYRSSLLHRRPWVVTGAYFWLKTGFDPAQILAQTEKNWEQRRLSQPYDLPSCGSVFRNPPQHSAGWLIEQTGLKGHRIGGAQVAQRHANFILNYDHARAEDIHRLIRFVQQQVWERWSLWLEPEVRLLGEF